MSFTFTEKTYVIGIWFVTHDKDAPVHERMDWMASAYRDSPDKPWEVKHRFRYHHSDDPFDEKDEKHWYSGTALEVMTEQEVEEKLTVLAELVALKNQSHVDFVPIHGDGEKVTAELMKQPWAHAKKEKVH
jgi:hypothetical protein